MREISLEQARRMALHAQGFCDPRPRGRVDARHFRRVRDRMTVLQLDSVNVLCRSHFLPVFSRLGAFDRDRLDDWLWRSGENLEFLAHEASITAIELYQILKHSVDIRRWKSGMRFRDKHAKYLAAITEAIKSRGPLSIKDIPDPGKRSGDWWGWSPGKIGLEVLYRSGVLAISERTPSFLTRYDLLERVVPASLRRDNIDPVAAKREMLRLAARSQGVATAKDLADYFRLKVTECRPLLKALVADGLLEHVQVAGWNQPAYATPDAKRPRTVKARALLSPFDPLVWFRPRAERLFGFHYRIEIYVPPAKRVHGYYVLPFLLGDSLVGRVDLKADRKSKTLVVKAAFSEPGFDNDFVAPPLAQTLHEMKDWLGLERIAVARRGNLAISLAQAERSFARR